MLSSSSPDHGAVFCLVVHWPFPPSYILYQGQTHCVRILLAASNMKPSTNTFNSVEVYYLPCKVWRQGGFRHQQGRLGRLPSLKSATSSLRGLAFKLEPWLVHSSMAIAAPGITLFTHPGDRKGCFSLMGGGGGVSLSRKSFLESQWPMLCHMQSRQKYGS